MYISINPQLDWLGKDLFNELIMECSLLVSKTLPPIFV